MVVVLVLHLMQVVIDGAYRAPREVNFWVGLILMMLVLGLSLTGYLLPWDQKGYWATKVATNLMGVVPGIGVALQRLAVGGTAYGHQTLTRFFALHAGLLPGMLMLFLALHIYVFRRHGIHARRPADGADGTFWPDQVFKDAVACLAVLAVVLFLVLWNRGANLGAPADPANPYAAARPEWYFLFLFQFLKYFHGDTEVYGAVVIPGLVFVVLFLMPIVGRWKLGHGFNIAFLVALLVGIGLLTGLAKNADRANPDYQAAVAEAERNAARAVQLAEGPTGIPAEGAIALLRGDPETMGPRLFKQNCATCHLYSGGPGRTSFQPQEPRASDLAGFASRQWLAGLLNPEKIAGPHYFGNTPHKDGEMVGFVKDRVAELDKADLEKAIAALSAQARLPAQRDIDARDADRIAAGVELIKKKLGCTDCHRFQDAGEEGTAPDLTGYGSRAWLIEFIKNPGAARFYGEKHHMPAFEKQRTPADIELIASWLRGEWYQAPGAIAGKAHAAEVVRD
jgi:ubiquinol-cytochrome c reductase cytochrome b subunit